MQKGNYITGTRIATIDGSGRLIFGDKVNTVAGVGGSSTSVEAKLGDWSAYANVNALSFTSTAASGAVALSGTNGAKFCPGANTACFTSNGTVISGSYLSVSQLYTGASGVSASYPLALQLSGSKADSATTVDTQIGTQYLLSTAGAEIVAFYNDAAAFTGKKAAIDKDGMLQIGIGNTGAVPTCDATHNRGKLWLVNGGAGVTDTVSICLKASADTYSWVTLMTGG